MSHEAGGKDRANSTAATNNRLKPPSNNDSGSMAPPGVEESTSQRSVEMGLETQENFAMGSKNQSAAALSSPPRANYMSSSSVAAENTALPIYKDHHANLVLEPPVTKTTLSELDVNKIVHNPKLRHDINFDPDLHFRPNLDGVKGQRKAKKANNFWDTMQRQLQVYLVDREQFEKELGGAEWCLPATLKAIRGILETLVPQRDRSSVEETFNVDLLMQQFRKGVADLPKLAIWLSQLLKCHCAPMRDSWVDEMVDQISKGDQNGDVKMLTLGMRNLLGVLEAMKLDVANHQIRCLRPLLIEDTVHFEQKYFMKKIASGKVDIADAHAWFRRASSIPDVEPLAHSQGNFWDFTKALVNLTLPSISEALPHTFLFDQERLDKLRLDMRDLINLEICMHMFKGLEASSRMQDTRSLVTDDTPVTSVVPSPYSRPASPVDNNIHNSPTLLPLPHHFEPKSKRLSQERGHCRRATSSQEVRVSRVENEARLSASPRSSMSSTASTPETYPPTPLYLSLPFIDSSSQLRSSLHAILASATTNDKWPQLVPSIALQILRSTTTTLTRLPQFESELAHHLSNTHSQRYREAEQRVLSQLFPILHKLVESYTLLTSLQIFEAATSTKTGANAAVPPNGVKEEINDVATRFAHIGMLHWRVWAPLAYLVDPDAEQEHVSNGRPMGMP